MGVEWEGEWEYRGVGVFMYERSGMVEETDREAGGDCGCSKGDERRK